MSRSAPGCAPATRHPPSANACAAGRRTSSSPRRSRSTSCSAPASGRAMLATTRTVIVDEIHAMAPNKRGAHLALSLERLTALCGGELARIGLSATQNPIDAIAHLLVGAASDGAPAAEVDDRRYRPSAAARSAAGSARFAAGSGDVGRSVAAGLRPAGAADRGASHHAGVRQYAPHGRARGAPVVGTSG